MTFNVNQWHYSQYHEVLGLFLWNRQRISWLWLEYSFFIGLYINKTFGLIKTTPVHMVYQEIHCRHHKGGTHSRNLIYEPERGLVKGSLTWANDWAQTFIQMFNHPIIVQCKHAPDQLIVRKRLFVDWSDHSCGHKNAHVNWGCDILGTKPHAECICLC